MNHLRKGRKLNRTSSHRKALLHNLATSLFEHKKIHTTEAKAKDLRPFAEKLITKAKHALVREKQGILPEGQTIDIHNRRIVGKVIRKKAVLQELFDVIAPMVEDRPGGYTRIVKIGNRRGDASPTAIIELIDWSAPKDGASSTKKTKKKKAAPQKTKKVGEVKEEVEEEIIEKTETAAAAEVAQAEETAEELTESAPPDFNAAEKIEAKQESQEDVSDEADEDLKADSADEEKKEDK